MSDLLVKQHFDRYKSEDSLAGQIESQLPSTHWRIVIQFYAAMHLLQAYLLTKNKRFHAIRHYDRSQAIRTSPELKRPFPERYRMLHNISEQVRYDPGFDGTGYFEKAATYLATVKQTLLPKLGRTGVS